MKKINLLLLLIVVIAIIAIIRTVIRLYLHHSGTQTPNANLADINLAVQIGFNIVYLIVAVVALFVAYVQINKTRESNTVQTLSNIDNNLKSNNFLEKRKKLAELVLTKKVDALSDWLKALTQKENLDENESNEIAIINNTFQAVIYEFEYIAYNYKKNIFSIEDVYQLFSIEIQQYWVLMDKLCFIEYLRQNKNNPRKDYFDKFESLFLDTIKQEIINDSDKLIKPFLKVYYWFDIYRLFYYLFKKRKHRIDALIKENQAMINQFLIEEKSLMD
jgi:uncharacterized membrane protein